MKKKLKLLLITVFAIMLITGMSTAAFAETADVSGSVSIPDGTYTVTGITSSIGMFDVEETGTAVVNGDTTTLTLTAGEKTIKRYSEIYIGSYDDTQGEGGDSIGTEGTIDGSKITFKVTMDTAKLLAPEIEYVLRYKAGYSDQHDHDWYKSNNSPYYYLTIGGLKTVSDLTIINKTSMFKAVSAALKTEITAEGSSCNLIMALSGSGYHELFKGTYEEADLNGDNRDNWVHGYQNDAGKWEFVIPLEKGESYVPCIAISNSYLEKYEKGDNPLSRAFYSRQINVDKEQKTLTTGDYEEIIDLTVTNNIKMFNPGETAKLHVIGGPNNNEYENTLTLSMGTDSFDKVEAIRYDNRGGNTKIVGAETIRTTEANQFIDIPVLTGVRTVLYFHSKGKDKWYPRDITIDKAAKGVTFDTHTESDAEEAFNATSIEQVEAQTFTGTEITPVIKLTAGDNVLVENQDYTVSYENNTDAGEAIIRVTGIGSYAGVKETTFSITAASIENAVIGAIPAATYTGKAITPKLDVKAGDVALTQDKDYTAEYKNNTDAGTAKVTVTGIGNYTGTKTAEFKILPTKQTLKVSAKKKTYKVKKLKKKAQSYKAITVTGAKGKLTYTAKPVGKKAKKALKFKNGKITVKKGTKKGTYKMKVTVKAAATKNYNVASAVKTIKIVVK